MNNRSWLCYTLDFLGLAALIGAAFALGTALWMSGTPAEAVMLAAFTYCLAAAVSALLVARACEIHKVMRVEEPDFVPDAPPDNVESLPTRSRLPRAA